MHSVVAIGLRFLAGAHYLDLTDVHDVCVAEVYRCIERFIGALLQNEDLKIKLPVTPKQWEDIRYKFASKSHERIFTHCIGAIDGFFQPTTVPAKKYTGGNQRAYYSGHYKSPGLNCQAICDSRLRFLYFGVVGTGSTNDSIAYYNTGLDRILKETLQFPLHLVGDAAYVESEILLTPFTGEQTNNPYCDAFNFYLSQLRICIEMAFGRLSSKWSILQRKLRQGLPNASKILNCCAILHNYVIDEDCSKIEDMTEIPEEEHCISPRPNAPFNMSYLPVVPDLYEASGSSPLKIALLDKITKNEYRRPLHNIVRKKQDLDRGIIPEFVSFD